MLGKSCTYERGIKMLAKIFMRRRIIHITLLLGVALVLLSACSSSDANNQGTSATPTSATVESASAIIRHSPSGTVLMKWDHTTHTLDVQVALTGLAPKSKHPVMINAGSCKDSGKMLYMLTDLEATQIGFANSKTTLENVTGGIPETGWSVSVSNGPGSSSADEAASISCANIFNPTASTTTSQGTTATLLNAFGPNQDVSGTADLSVNNKVLMVTIMLKGLAPNSKHIAHIHYGSCASQGPVLHNLKPVIADAAGNATSVTTIPDVESIPRNGWYVNIHLGGGDIKSQTMNDPIACGDITQFH